MRNTILAISAYLLSAVISLSFFIFLFKLLQFSYLIGFAFVSFLVLITCLLINDPDFIQEAEEY